MMIRERTKSVKIMKRRRLGTATTLIRQGGSRDDDKDVKGEKDGSRDDDKDVKVEKDEERPFVTITVNEGDLG